MSSMPAFCFHTGATWVQCVRVVVLQYAINPLSDFTFCFPSCSNSLLVCEVVGDEKLVCQMN